MDQPIAASPEVVTASELVRHFGVWQERAARAPVYVMFHGRPRLVLTSTEVMKTLVAPLLPERNQQGPDIVALLDLIRDMVVIADADLRIIAASRTARAYFSDSVTPGTSVDALVSQQARHSFRKTLRHVVVAGVSQAIDLPSPRSGLLGLTIEPHRNGVAVLIVNLS